MKRRSFGKREQSNRRKDLLSQTSRTRFPFAQRPVGAHLEMCACRRQGSVARVEDWNLCREAGDEGAREKNSRNTFHGWQSLSG